MVLENKGADSLHQEIMRLFLVCIEQNPSIVDSLLHEVRIRCGLHVIPKACMNVGNGTELLRTILEENEGLIQEIVSRFAGRKDEAQIILGCVEINFGMYRAKPARFDLRT